MGVVSRVDVAEGEERRNLVFEYNIAEDAIYGVAEGATSVRAMHSTTARLTPISDVWHVADFAHLYSWRRSLWP